MRGIACGNVHLIRGDDAELGIPEFPPELMTDNGDVEGSRRLWRVLNRVNDPGSCQKQDRDNQNRSDRPRQLDLGAAIDLGRLAVGIDSTASELDDRVRQQGKND